MNDYIPFYIITLVLLVISLLVTFKEMSLRIRSS